MTFTSKTLAQFDDIDPPVLDVIFEYKLKDAQMQSAEAKEIVRAFKQRDMDPERKVIQKIEREVISIRRKQRKVRKSIDFKE